MTSTLKSLALLMLLCTVPAVQLVAQTQTTPLQAPQVKLSDAEKEFDESVRLFEKYLYDAGVFAVDVTSDWVFKQAGNPAQGTNIFRVAVQKGGKYRIEAGSAARGKAEYVCVSDAKQITRYHRSAKLYAQRPVSPTHDDLQNDALTAQILNGSGVELLIRPQIRAQLIAQIQRVQRVGDEMLESQPVVHMRLTLINQRMLDAWFTKQNNPLMLQLASIEKIPVSDTETIEMTTTSKFKWTVGKPLPANTFTAAIPAEAKRVENLLAAMRKGGL